MAWNDELFGGAELDAVGERIAGITFDSEIVILIGDRRDHHLRMSNVINVTAPGRVVYMVCYEPFAMEGLVRENVSELLEIIGCDVLHARAFVDGRLEFVLSNGHVLTVEALEEFEAWMYVHNNFILACPPGGFGSSDKDAGTEPLEQ